MDLGETHSDIPDRDADSRSPISDPVFSPASEVGCFLRKRKILRNIKTQTSNKSSNKKTQFSPAVQDQGSQLTLSETNSAVQTQVPVFVNSGTEPWVRTQEISLQTAMEPCSSHQETQVSPESIAADSQTISLELEPAETQCGGLFFFMRTVSVQAQETTQTIGVQADSQKVSVGVQNQPSVSMEKLTQTSIETADFSVGCGLVSIDLDGFRQDGTVGKTMGSQVRKLKEDLKGIKALYDEEQAQVQILMNKVLETILSVPKKLEFPFPGKVIFEELSGQEEGGRLVETIDPETAVSPTSEDREPDWIEIQECSCEDYPQGNESQLALRSLRDQYNGHIYALETAKTELEVKVDLLRGEQAHAYMRIRELEFDLKSEQEEKVGFLQEITLGNERISLLEKELFTLRLGKYGDLEASTTDSECEEYELQVRLAQFEIEVMNFRRIQAEKDAKIDEQKESIDSLQLQVRHALKEVDRFRIDNRLSKTYYENESLRLQEVLQKLRFDHKQLLESHHQTNEDLETAKTTIEEYQIKAGILTQEKSRMDIAFRAAVFDLKHAENEVGVLQKTVAKLEKERRELEEIMEKARLLQHGSQEMVLGEVKYQMQVQRLESEKLELQTELVEHRHETETLKDQIQACGDAMWKLQEALEAQKQRSGIMETALNLTKSALKDITTKKELAETQKNAFSEEIGKTNSDLDRLKAELEQKVLILQNQEGKINALSLSIDVEKAQNLSLQQEITDLKSQLNTEKRLKTETETVLKQLQGASEEKESWWSQEKEDLIVFNERLNARFEALQNDFGKLKAEETGLKEDIWNKAERINRLEACQTVDELQISETQKKLVSASAEIDELREKLTILERENTNLQSNLQKTEFSLESSHKETSVLETRITELSAEMLSIASEKAIQEILISDLQRQIRDQSTETQQEKLVFEEMKTSNFAQNLRLVEEIQLERSKYAALETQIREMKETEIDRLKTENESKSHEIEVLTESKTDLEARMTDLMASHMCESTQFQSKIASLSLQLKSTTEQLQETELSEARAMTKKEELTERLTWYQGEYEKASMLKKVNIHLSERVIELTEELRHLQELAKAGGDTSA